MSPRSKLIRILLALCLLGATSARAVTPDIVAKLCGDAGSKSEVIATLVAQGDASAIPLLQALQEGTLHIANGKQAVIVGDDGPMNAVTGVRIDIPEESLEKVTINNRLRGELDAAIAALQLAAPDAATRLAAARAVGANADASTLPLIERALAKEIDGAVRQTLASIRAILLINDPDAGRRIAAVKALAQAPTGANLTLLRERLGKSAEGSDIEPDESVRREIKNTISAIETSLAGAEYLGRAFSGLSLGSILLLAALGLAITFGLMGIINMAHGELLMIGAYATYVVQVLFRQYLPGAFDWYLLAAVPVAFLCAALVGVALERSVIRFLYGRPLETLLATWGISLILIQTVRAIFGAQNVEVANPDWMSGGIAFASGLVLPYNRIVIIVFAASVVAAMWLILTRTRLGLYVRAVTQNRTMADCVGVPTPRVDMLAFGLGSGIAGLGGCALSQIGNVGPELGQSYIVDSFMVVVLGGVGQLVGTVVAALGLGEVNKFLEPYAGAVLAKIFVLVFIIVFIQKRPQGLFALKGRQAES